MVDGPGARFDSAGRLARKYIDVAVASAEELDLIGVFLNVTAFRPTGGGYVEVYTPRPSPGAALDHLPAAGHRDQQHLRGAARSASTAATYYTVRIFTSRADPRAWSTCSVRSPASPPTGVGRDRCRRHDRRLQRQAKQRARLIKAIKNR